MLSSDSYLELLKAKVGEIFKRYVDGVDVSPATIYRAEGFIEAGCELGLISQEDAQKAIEAAWKEFFDEEIGEQNLKGIHIPLFMERAPVYPST